MSGFGNDILACNDSNWSIVDVYRGYPVDYIKESDRQKEVYHRPGRLRDITSHIQVMYIGI